MDFSVNAPALDGLAEQMDLRARDLSDASNYLQQHSVLRSGSGLLNELMGTHKRVMTEVEAFLHRAGHDYCSQYSIAISEAIHAYTTMDQAASTRMDATIPGSGTAPSAAAHLADQKLGPDIFVTRQLLHLDTPPDYQAEYPYHPQWYDLLSPTSITRDVIWSVSWICAKLGLLDRAYDPYETCAEPLCGDWAGLETVSFALTQVARALSFVSLRIRDDATTADRVWTGNAAVGCESALREFADDLGPAQALVIQIAADYHEVAQSARRQGEALTTLVGMLVDIGGSCGGELAIEVGLDLADEARLIEVSAQLDEIFTEIKAVLEILHMAIEAKNSDLTSLCERLAILTDPGFNVGLPSGMPVLPHPYRR